MRVQTVLVLAVVAAAPVAAQVATGGQRFAVTPAETGVTRVDTQTGAVSHCTQTDGVWFCDRVGDAAGAVPAAPSPDLKRLTDAITALTGKVDRLSSDLAARPAGSGASASAAPPSFAATAVNRLLGMVRKLKPRGHDAAVTPGAT